MYYLMLAHDAFWGGVCTTAYGWRAEVVASNSRVPLPA